MERENGGGKDGHMKRKYTTCIDNNASESSGDEQDNIIKEGEAGTHVNGNNGAREAHDAMATVDKEMGVESWVGGLGWEGGRV